jgi:hypothetical protein
MLTGHFAAALIFGTATQSKTRPAGEISVAPGEKIGPEARVSFSRIL